MLYPKWAICYIYYKTSEGLVIFWIAWPMKMKVLWSFKTVGTTHPVMLCHTPIDALSLTQWHYVTSHKIWILRPSTDKISCSKIHSNWLIPLHYNSDKNDFPSIISQGNFINYYQLQHCTNFRLQIKCQHSKIHLKASTLTL
jgi:hypothetical protein